MEAQGGFEVAFHGEYREIVPEQRIVTTEVFEGAPPSDAGDVLNVITFSRGRRPHDARAARAVPRTRRSATRSWSSGMEVGMQEQYDALEELVVSLER